MSGSISKILCSFPGCQKEFSSIYNLERHKDSVHLQLKNFKCQHCGRQLSSKQNLNEHLFIHTGEKPYKCDQPNCGEVFRQRCQLLNHKKIHQELLKFIQSNRSPDEKKWIIDDLKIIMCEVKGELQKSPSETLEKVDFIDSAFLKDRKIHLPPLF